jgi:hypothetical protein
MTLAAQVDKLKQRFGLSRVVLVGGCAHRWSQLWHTRVLAQDKRQMRLRRRGTDGLHDSPLEEAGFEPLAPPVSFRPAEEGLSDRCRKVLCWPSS